MNSNPIILLQSEINSVLKKYWISFLGREEKILDYGKAFTTPWFGALKEWVQDILKFENNYLSRHADFQQLHNNIKKQNSIGFFPAGISFIDDISRQLDTLLPQEKIIKTVLPVLLTCYIYKYNESMKDSTLDFISRLIYNGDKKEVDAPIDRKLSCFTLSPIFERLSKITYKDISITNYAILRRYHVSILFVHLLLCCKDICNVSLSLRLFTYMGDDMEVFLSPNEYRKAGLESYEYGELEQDCFRNEIIGIIEERAKKENFEFDLISLRFKRFRLSQDSSYNAEEKFLKSLTPEEQALNKLGFI